MPEVYQIVCLSELGNAFKLTAVGTLTLEEIFNKTSAQQLVIFRPAAPSAAFPCRKNPKHDEPSNANTAKSKLPENGKEAPIRSARCPYCKTLILRKYWFSHLSECKERQKAVKATRTFLYTNLNTT